MKANFYIIPESFQYDGEEKSILEEKIKNFAIDLRRIKETDGNEIFCNPEIYYQPIFETKTIHDIINDYQQKIIDRDVVQQLRIIWELEETDALINDIEEIYLPNHTKDECHGLIAFKEIEGIPSEYQLVYGIDSWFKFKRYFLGLYPGSAEYFIPECGIYFENLYFHERNNTTANHLLPHCAKRVLHHLGELNDKFTICRTSPYNRVETLKVFNTVYEHDGQEASQEGDAARKKHFTFSFVTNNGSAEDVCCEPHLKISYTDNGGDFSNDRRIYFHEGKNNIEGGKILIGHIGKHL